MAEPVLLDTGVIVAMLSRRDAAHRRCVEALKTVRPPLCTCWPVVVEAAWLLRRGAREIARLFEWVGDPDKVAVMDVSQAELARIHEIMRAYADQEVDFADACLLYVAERERLTAILSIDEQFATVYRVRDRPLTVLPGPV